MARIKITFKPLEEDQQEAITRQAIEIYKAFLIIREQRRREQPKSIHMAMDSIKTGSGEGKDDE